MFTIRVKSVCVCLIELSVFSVCGGQHLKVSLVLVKCLISGKKSQNVVGNVKKNRKNGVVSDSSAGTSN